MSNLINRPDVLDALLTGKEFLLRLLDDMDIVGPAREKYSWGVELIESFIDDVEELLSAEPEIIRCKGCKHHHYEKDIPYCDRIDYGYGWKDNDYCSRAERRKNA